VRVALVVTPQRLEQLRAGWPALVRRCGVSVVRQPSHTELVEDGLGQLARLGVYMHPTTHQGEDNLRGIQPPPVESLAALTAAMHEAARDLADRYKQDAGRHLQVCASLPPTELP
jgi:hypothetical protein